MMKIIGYVFIIFTFYSCSTNEDYPYKKGLNHYMNNNYNHDIKAFNNKTLIFIHLEYCSSCIKDALFFLDSINLNNHKINLYLIGDPNYYTDNNDVLFKLNNKFDTFTDKDSNHYSYISGIGEPLIMDIKKGKIIKYSYINSENINNIEDTFF